MLKQVLESVSEMLGQSLVTPQSGEVTITYVRCAKTLLDKTIVGMEKEEGFSFVQTKGPAVILQEEQSPIYNIDVHPVTKLLMSITTVDGKELDDDVMIEINGTAYTYKEAKGKPFQTGRVL